MPRKLYRVESDLKNVRAADDTRPRMGRCAIRVSALAGRGKKNADGTVDRAFYSPSVQSSVAAEYFGREGITYDEAASLANCDLDRRASKRGSRLSREGLQKHLEDAKKGLFTDLAFYKVSRMSREMGDGWAIVEELMDAGIKIHFLRDQLPDVNTPAGRMALGIWLEMAAQESRNLAQHNSDSIIARWRAGKPHGSPRSWILKSKDHSEGYSGPHIGSPSLYEISIPGQQRHPTGWTNYRRMVELALEDRSYAGIARTLNEEGRFTRRGCVWRHGDVMDHFTPEGIDALLGNARSFPLNSSGEIIRLTGVYLPLITEEEAAMLRVMYDTRRPERLVARSRNGHGPGGRGVAHEARMLGGRLYCSRCGHALVADQGWNCGRKVSYNTYTCRRSANGLTAHVGEFGPVHVVAEAIDESVLRAIRHEASLPPEQLRHSKPPKNSALSVTSRGKAASKKQRTLPEIDADASDLVERLQRGTIPQFSFDARMRSLEAEREMILTPVPGPLPEDTVKAFLDTDKQSPSNEEQMQARRLLVKALVEEVSYPYEVRGRYRHKPQCHRAALITMKSGSIYLAPVYTARYKGPRALIKVDDTTPLVKV